jgi:hypothetical protein
MCRMQQAERMRGGIAPTHHGHGADRGVTGTGEDEAIFL